MEDSFSFYHDCNYIPNGFALNCIKICMAPEDGEQYSGNLPLVYDLMI